MMTIEHSTNWEQQNPVDSTVLVILPSKVVRCHKRPKIGCKARKEKSRDMRRLCLAVMPSIWV